MLIDIILDRKDGQAYNSRAFYNACMGYAQTFPCCLPVVRALDGGTEQDVIIRVKRKVVRRRRARPD